MSAQNAFQITHEENSMIQQILCNRSRFFFFLSPLPQITSHKVKEKFRRNVINNSVFFILQIFTSKKNFLHSITIFLADYITNSHIFLVSKWLFNSLWTKSIHKNIMSFTKYFSLSRFLFNFCLLFLRLSCFLCCLSHQFKRT